MNDTAITADYTAELVEVFNKNYDKLYSCTFRMIGNHQDTEDVLQNSFLKAYKNIGKFPCENLMPLANGADRFPHNLKIYNLCMMKRIGVEAWNEMAGDIRKTYFTKGIVIGEGGSKET